MRSKKFTPQAKKIPLTFNIVISLIGIVTSTTAAVAAYYSYRATQEQADIARATLPIVKHQSLIEYFLTLPRVILVPEYQERSVSNNFCVLSKNIGKFPTIGYEIFSIEENSKFIRRVVSSQPLYSESTHKHCISSKREILNLIVITQLPGIVQQGVLPLTNFRTPPGGQYRCEYFSFALQNKPDMKDHIVQTYIETPREIINNTFRLEVPSSYRKGITCDSQYRII